MVSPDLAALALPQFKGRPGWEFTDISGLALETRGRHELKGLTGARELFRVAPSA